MIALAFYGQPRFVKESYSSIYHNVIIPNNITSIFAHLWSSSHMSNGGFKVQIKDNNFAENLEIFKQYYKPTYAIIQPQELFDVINSRKSGNSNLPYIEEYFNFAFVSAWNSRKRIISLIEKEYKNITHVILTRTDSIFEKSFFYTKGDILELAKYGSYNISDNLICGRIDTLYRLFNQNIPKVSDGTAEILMETMIKNINASYTTSYNDYSLSKQWKEIE